MSYDVSAHYAAENTTENRLEWPLKPIIGINHGRKRPLILANDKFSAVFALPNNHLPQMVTSYTIL
jgi:hypothetical protein